VVLGKEGQIRLALACLLARGHLLIEDIPGIGKTTLAKALALVLGLDFKRVQFTNDLLPSDVLGVSVYDAPSSAFVFHPGPVFTNVLLADEINRGTPRTQSALLEVMEEQQVSLDASTRLLPRPFFVLATQNALDQAGTYPLPESQMDRFLIRLSMGYPARDEDRFKFAAKKGERLVIRARSAALGFPADAVLKLEDGQGKQLARDDDGGEGPDAKLVWTAPADGSYVVSVADLFHKGGEDYVYRLEVDHARPAFKAALESDALRIEAGKTTEIKIKVMRVNDRKGELLARVKHLPPGVTAPEVKVTEKGGEVKLVLTATADAKPANGPIQIEVAATDPKDTRVWRATRDLKDKDARGDLLVSETDQVWLTVSPAAPEKPKVAAKKK